MTLSFNTSLDAKTALWPSAGAGMRAARVGSPVAIALAGGAAMTHGVRTTDRNPYALVARCAE